MELLCIKYFLPRPDIVLSNPEITSEKYVFVRRDLIQLFNDYVIAMAT